MAAISKTTHSPWLHETSFWITARICEVAFLLKFKANSHIRFKSCISIWTHRCLLPVTFRNNIITGLKIFKTKPTSIKIRKTKKYTSKLVIDKYKKNLKYYEITLLVTKCVSVCTIKNTARQEYHVYADDL